VNQIRYLGYVTKTKSAPPRRHFQSDSKSLSRVKGVQRWRALLVQISVSASQAPAQ
jgi:hypothetical protein